MPSRYKFFRDAWDDDLKHTIKSFPDINFKEILSGPDDVMFRIPLEFEYRPDLIAYKFYNDPTLFWVLVYANDFSNSPADFEANKVIRVPRLERIIGII